MITSSHSNGKVDGLGPPGDTDTQTLAVADRTLVLIVVALASFLTPFDVSAVNIALPSIASAFAMDAVTLAWVATAYSSPWRSFSFRSASSPISMVKSASLPTGRSSLPLRRFSSRSHFLAPRLLHFGRSRASPRL